MGGAKVEYKVFEMDILRDRSAENLQRKAREARALIESWKPDLVYGSDDAAQEYVAAHYVGRDLPFVVSGVNRDPAVYGLAGAKNVAGVLEPVHIEETLRLLHVVAPATKRFAIITDESPSMLALADQIKAKLARLPGAQVVAHDTVRTFPAYQQAVRRYQDSADALWPLGVFGLRDAAGAPVDRIEVLRWTADNSRLPDLGFWEERVAMGTLVAVTVSPREHGLAAGRIARGILVERRSPASYGIRPDVKGLPMVSLARANKLGLKLKSSVLLSAEVVEKFEWEKQ